jgi:hypothetical protein
LEIAMTDWFRYCDGGRAEAGFTNKAKGFGDCVVRAIAIATGRGYQQAYDDIFGTGKTSPLWYRTDEKCTPLRGFQLMPGNECPDDGVCNAITKRVLKLEYGWVYRDAPGPFVLSHLPLGPVIVQMDSMPHHCAVIDRVIYDDCDEADEPSQGGSATIKGYWTPPPPLSVP